MENTKMKKSQMRHFESFSNNVRSSMMINFSVFVPKISALKLFFSTFSQRWKKMEDIEKGVETAELWVERLRIAAVEHYSKHHVPQDLKMQKKTVDYVKQNITQSGSVSSEDQDLNQSPINDEPMVKCPLNHSTLK